MADTPNPYLWAESYLDADRHWQEILRLAREAAPGLLRGYRNTHGLTQAELAVRLRCARSNVASFETGTPAGVRALRRLAELISEDERGGR